MSKKGYVLRSIIESAIESELASKGVSDANIKARSYISEFKKSAKESKNKQLILNAGTKSKEQYETQALGEWLFNRRDPLREFRTPVCPFKANFHVSVSETMEVNAGTLELSKKELQDPNVLATKLMQQGIEYEQKIAKLKERIFEYERKEAKTKSLKQIAGNEGGRGRSKY